MKLVVMRPQDVPDIVALAHQVGLGTAAAAYADLLEPGAARGFVAIGADLAIGLTP